MKKCEIKYIKPNMCNLHGRTGRAVMEAIRSMEEPDFTDLIRESDECEKKILASRQNVVSKDYECENQFFLDTMQGLIEAVSIEKMKLQQHENGCISTQDVQLNSINELFNKKLLSTEQFKILEERIKKQNG